MSNRAERRRAEKLAREKVKKQIAKATRERSCGDCTACCTAQGVKELGKPAGVACRYLSVQDPTPIPQETTASLFAGSVGSPGKETAASLSRSALGPYTSTLVGGCSRYAFRPESCRSWSCLWRVGLFDAESDRPDKRGLVFDVTGKVPALWPGPTYQALVAREARSGAFEENEAWLDELSSTNVVVLVFPEGRRVLGPPDVVEEVERKMRRLEAPDVVAEVERKMRRVLPVVGGAS